MMDIYSTPGSAETRTPSSKVTLQEIAALANVSVGTVHRALYGKKGVSDTLRQRILEIAEEKKYVRHLIKSGAIRQRVLILAPGLDRESRYYYEGVWAGIHDFTSGITHQNFSVVEIPYFRALGNTLTEELISAYRRFNGDVAGALICGSLTSQEQNVVRDFARKGLPIILATDVMPDILASVSVNFYAAGRLVAEFLSCQLPDNASVLLCAGDMGVTSHCRIVDGFTDYLHEHGDSLSCVYVYSNDNGDSTQRKARKARVAELLNQMDSIKAIFCVNARESVLVTEVLHENSLKGKYRFIGSDLFPENISSMREGIMQNILYKSPHQQAYLAAKLLFTYLLNGTIPAPREQFLACNIIFNSNLDMHWQDM